MTTGGNKPLLPTSLPAMLVGLSLSLALPPEARGAAQGSVDIPQNAPAQQVPAGVILVKGAWSSASDSVTPVPEGGTVTGRDYNNPYFHLTYFLSAGWIQKYAGPPPSDSGLYVLAQIQPPDTFKGTSRGSVLITAQDMFFTPTPAKSALELINYTQSHLRADYAVEQSPERVTLAGHSFIKLGYVSPVAELHWSVLATQIRCHIVQFTFSSRDPQVIQQLTQTMSGIKLPSEAGPEPLARDNDEFPPCVANYASGQNVITRVDPVLSEHRFNPIPVRVIIDTSGQIKHVHFLSAFPEQAKAITDALQQWRFKPYLRDGQPAEVETGILFGRGPAVSSSPTS